MLQAIEYDWHRQFLISFPASKTEYFETRISVPLHTVAGASPFPLYTRAMGQLRGRNCVFAWLATAPRTSPVRGIVDALHNSAAVPQALGVRKEKNKHVAACTSLVCSSRRLIREMFPKLPLSLSCPKGDSGTGTEMSFDHCGLGALEILTGDLQPE